MAGTTPLSYELVPWVRRGLSSLIGGAATQGYASLPVSLALNGTSITAPPVRLIGPGDVTGIDARAVIRTDPRDRSDAFEPNYFATIEFAAPDFPWMFTPSGVVNGRLQPWLCLIVLPDGPGATVQAAGTLPSVLRIDAPLIPKDELPDLSTIDTWAHAQVTGAGLSEATLTAAFDGDPALTCSRLIAARKLEPNTAYIACVVPTYRAGVHAGLGLTVDPSDVAPAWDASVSAPFLLPAYYTTRFRTGPGGDFGSLARKIVPEVIAASAGTRNVDFGQPGFGVPDVGTMVLGLEGALQTLDAASTPWPDGSRIPFQSALRGALTPVTAADPIVAPPTYGAAQSGATLPEAGHQPVWLEHLNLDPRARSAAGAGVQVVQTAREALAASAWDQAGEIRKANALLKRAQLARAISGALNARHLAPVTDGAYLQMTGPVHARVTLLMNGSLKTLHRAVAESALPDAAVSGALRRFTRPRGIVGRQLPAAAPDLVARLNTAVVSGGAGVRVLAPLAVPRGMVAFNDIDANIALTSMVSVPVRAASAWNLPARSALAAHEGAAAINAERVETAPANSGAEVATESATAVFKEINLPAIFRAPNLNIPALITLPADATQLAAFADNFSAAAKVTAAYVNVGQAMPAVRAPLGGTATTLTSTRVSLAAKLDPERTIGLRVGARIPLGTGRDPLQPVRRNPSFPQAMYAALSQRSPEWMLPGISSIANNSATMLAANDRFVEAYMIGLNDELARELLWRGFPADMQGTYFRNFWSPSAPDIEAIDAFSPGGDLGDHIASGTSVNREILLVRASLFARYPNAVVVAVRAQWSGAVRTLTSQRTYPLFRGNIGGDVTFFGFDIPDARGSSDPSKNDPGWYFAIEEHVTEPRFGLEPDAGNVNNPTWNELSWSDITPAGGFLDPAVAPATAPVREGVAWSASAATMAFILERRPVRVAMHALALLGPDSTPVASP
jgi:hypothetical protein